MGGLCLGAGRDAQELDLNVKHRPGTKANLFP